MAYATYTAVTPVGTENPMKEKWYVKINNVYHRTDDTTVVAGKTYFSKGGGYLIKVGTYTIPSKYIKADTFNSLWSTTDVDSYRDANVTLHRDSVQERHVLKVEFETPDMGDTEFDDLMSHIESQYLGTTTLWNGTQAKTCQVTAWVPEKRAYKTDYCYIPDLPIQIRYADERGLKYNPIRFAFIGYASDSAM